MSVKGLPVCLLVAWISRSRKLPGLHPDRMLTSWLPPLAVPLAAASRARVSLISSAHRARSLRRACHSGDKQRGSSRTILASSVMTTVSTGGQH